MANRQIDFENLTMNLGNKWRGGGFDSNPKIPLSIFSDAKYLDKLKEHFNHESDWNMFSLFKDNAAKAQYADVIKFDNLYLRNIPFNYDVELILELAYVISNLSENGKTHLG